MFVILLTAQGAEKKLFGFSFLPLEDMLQGTTVADGLHTLLLYKVSNRVSFRLSSEGNDSGQNLSAVGW